MNKHAILHIPMSEYAHGIAENKVIIRLRSARKDLTSCRIYFGDRSCRLTPVVFTMQEMKVVAFDELYDYYEVILTDCYKRLCYYFELSDNNEKCLYYGDIFSDKTVDDRSEYYQFPYNHKDDIADTPKWIKQAVFYNIFPDSFATSKRYISEKPSKNTLNGITTEGLLGGTIKGITENIDYIKTLGFNAIYLNPIFTATSYHKYDLMDYFHIDPCFGTDNDFKDLVETAHHNGIKVVIDGVFNHCSWHFFAFEDVCKNGEKSKYLNWFSNLKLPVIKPESPEVYPEYECFGYERSMPKVNTCNPEVIEYFCKVCVHWVKNYDIDGWRLDVASEINSDFWRIFRKTLKSEKADAVLIGEVWESANFWLDGKQFDSTMNYDMRKHCKYFFAENSIDASEFNTRVTNMLIRYRKNMLYSQLNLLDSHDVTRFLSLCKGNIQKLKLAVLFQMTFIGAPSVLYGDEQGIDGILECEYRSPMKWNNGDLYDFYKNAISLRNSFSILSLGEFQTIECNRNSMLYCYKRFNEEGTIYIALNSGEKQEQLPECLTSKRKIWSCNSDNNKIGSYGFCISMD